MVRAASGLHTAGSPLVPGASLIPSAMREVLLIAGDLMLAHGPGPGHPEQPARLAAILGNLRADPIPGTRWATPAAHVSAGAGLPILGQASGIGGEVDPALL